MIASLYSAVFLNRTATFRNGSDAWKVFAITLVVPLFAFAASASAQTAQWVKQMGTGGISNGVSSDAAGNAYATGSPYSSIEVFTTNP